MLGQVMECGKCVLAFCRLHAQYVRVIESNEKEGQLEKTKIQKEIKETRRKFLKQLEKFLELIEKDGDLRLKRLFSRIQFNDWSIAAATENVAC